MDRYTKSVLMGSNSSICIYMSLSTWNLLDKSGTDRLKCYRKVASGRKVEGVIRTHVNAGRL